MLEQLKAGDKIIIRETSRWQEMWVERDIVAVTPKQIVVSDGYRFWIKDGLQMGGARDRAYHPDQVIKAEWNHETDRTARQRLEYYRAEIENKRREKELRQQATELLKKATLKQLEQIVSILEKKEIDDEL